MPELSGSTHGGRAVRLVSETLFDPTDLGLAPPVGEVATVWLNSLTASPGSVLPFQAATITWDVHAEAGPLHVLLNGDLVGLSGSKVVTPQSSSVYRIFARTPHAIRELGQVSVAVDSRLCTTYRPGNVLNVLDRAWERGLEASEKLTLSGAPQVSFANARVHLRADLKFELGPLPGTGNGTIRASFKIGVADREVVATEEDVDVRLKLPLWARMFPEARFKVAFAQVAATQQVHSAISDLATLIGFLGAAPRGSALDE